MSLPKLKRIVTEGGGASRTDINLPEVVLSSPGQAYETKRTTNPDHPRGKPGTAS